MSCSWTRRSREHGFLRHISDHTGAKRRTAGSALRCHDSYMSVSLSNCLSVHLSACVKQKRRCDHYRAKAVTHSRGSMGSDDPHCTFFHCSCSHILMVSFDNYSVCGPCSGRATYTILIFFVL